MPGPSSFTSFLRPLGSPCLRHPPPPPFSARTSLSFIAPRRSFSFAPQPTPATSTLSWATSIPSSSTSSSALSTLLASRTTNSTAAFFGGLKQTVKSDLNRMTENIKARVGNDHPVLDTVAKYYFEQQGKRIRPLIVILLSRAINNHKRVHFPSLAKDEPDLLPKQLQLAEIVEMIHTASLIHDDILDDSDTRRGVSTVNALHGSKLAVLAGDFLLARASVSLAQLRNHEVTELMATVIANLVEGEVLQMKPLDFSFDTYLTKTYLKTASLIGNGCRCAAILGGMSREIVDRATEFGRDLGVAFQLIDDLLDFVESVETLGKPAAVDLELGLATAPVLYALEEFPELAPLIERRFSVPGDVPKVQTLVRQSQGVLRTKQLAEDYANRAVEALSVIEDSEARAALLELTVQMLQRRR